ncbi:MAG: 30S ribosomal protein S12 methylthiotransferase RimO [Firmicutes bacterium]|nr:30S ribosomal protein S12 methylthiotransferase RimO [Candidatus Caballimonas caccae]
MDKKTVGVISLGCDKNRVDTEKMLYILSKDFFITNDIEKAQIVIINTCAFLKSSREEAIGEILETALRKNNGTLEKIIVTGCLPQKFIDEIFDELTEVDAFLGVSDYDKIVEVIKETYQNKRVNAVGVPKGECIKKRILTTSNYAYLKIADGCSNHCTYCLIPKIRGAFRSVPAPDLIEEAKALGKVKELILVAQDCTKYGEDLFPKTSLVELIRKLSALNNIEGIRLLYCYPENVNDELIHELAVNAKMIRYIDIPLQHADNGVLKQMNRKGTKEEYLALINKLKSQVHGIAIRSTFITGFPNESEEAFENLIDFLKKAKLFNAGFFKYSKEEDTPSFKLCGHLPESVKSKRLRKLYSVQKSIVKENYMELIGKTFYVLAEGFDENELVYYGRAYFNAPDIDGKVYFFSSSEVVYGEKYKIKILKADGYDLYGERV